MRTVIRRSSLRVPSFVGLGLFALSSLAGAQDAPDANAWPTTADSRPKVGGRWEPVEEGHPPYLGRAVTNLKRLRHALKLEGIELHGAYVGEWSSVVDGGLDEASSYRNLTTIDLEIDLERFVGLRNTKVFAQFLSANGESGGTADSGDIQVYSNIETDFAIDSIYELWVEKEFTDAYPRRMKFGKFDANSEFHVFEEGGDFSHSSPGFSPTIVGFPSYPFSATGAVLEFDIEGIVLSYGFFDGAFEPDGVNTTARGPGTFFLDDQSSDYFHIAEVEIGWGGVSGVLPGQLTLGAALHTGRFPTFDGGRREDVASFHVMIEQCLRDRGFRTVERQQPSSARATTPNRRVSGHRRIVGDVVEITGPEIHFLAHYGYTNDEVIPFEQNVGAGFVVKHLWETAARADDSAGIYASYVELSDEPGANFDDFELAFDAYYKFQFSRGWFLQPELQYIVDPGQQPGIDDAFIAGFRFGWEF